MKKLPASPNWKALSESWENFAAQQFEGSQYYRGLLVKIGINIGKEAYIQDDGGIVDSPLVAKIPELVKKLIKENKKLKKKQKMKTFRINKKVY